MTHHTLFPVFQWKRKSISVNFTRLWHILILLLFLVALVGIPVSSVQAAAPVVSGIPDQTIAEGLTFATINLDEYVADSEHSADQMTWTYSGNTALSVIIDANRVATISIPDADWNGFETITFTATDPGLLSGYDSAVFTVTPENDPPVITGQVPLSTLKNTPLTITLADLTVTDVDNTYPTGFSLTVLPGANYAVVDDTITPDADFVGTLTVPVTVNDGEADSDPYNLSVAVYVPRTYYVDNTNKDCVNGDLGTQLTPLCTISRGEFLALPGDIVHVLKGTYAETVFVEHSGLAGYPITYQAAPGVTVTGDSSETGFGSAFAIGGQSYIVIDGFNIYHTKYKGIYVNGSHHITISNNHVSYAGAETSNTTHQQGIYMTGTTDSTITGNTTDHNSCIGIRLIGGSDNNTVSNNISFANASVIADPDVAISDAAGIELTGSNHNTVINNITYGNEDSGINLYVGGSGGSSYNLVIGNLSYGNGDHGIDNNDSPNNTVVGNTVHGNGTVGINFEGDTGSFGATVANNISAANGLNPPTGSFGGNLRVDAQSIADTTLDYDLFDLGGTGDQIIWNDTSYASLAALHEFVPGQEVHGSEGDPLFVAPVAPVLRADDVIVPGSEVTGNYHLQALSPAIDSANSDASNQPLTDIEGNPRVDDPATEPDTGAGTRTYDDRGAYEFQLGTFTLTYTAGDNGSLTGTSPQTVNYGGNGTAVTAVPVPNYYFAGWDDGSTDNPRMDTNVKADVNVIASFNPYVCVNVNVAAGWNMVSVPVVADDMSLDALFPEIDPPAYAFTNTYINVETGDSLSAGVGYWMYFNEEHTYLICGQPAGTRDIPVNAGWNMIGPFEVQVLVTSITSTPDEILSPPLYSFSNTYFEASTLEPGSGYWAYADRAGTLHLGGSQAGLLAIQKQVGQCSLNWQASINVVDGGENSELLWIGQGPYASDGLNDSCGEARMPPKPPVGSFDARLVLPGGLDAARQDYRSSLSGQIEWRLEFQAGKQGGYFTFTWDPAALPKGIWQLQDPFGGLAVDLDMNVQGSYKLDGLELDRLLVVYEPAKTGFQLYLPLVKP